MKSRLAALDKEIEQKQQAKQLLSALIGEGDESAWHQAAISDAPDAHLHWLKTQGFNEKEALRLKWLSKNMTQHDQYMNDFMHVFEALERWGPGSESETNRAISNLPNSPSNVLEIGCGKGLATRVLAKTLNAKIIATDNEQSALDSINEDIAQLGLSEKVSTQCASMTDLPFEQGTFDLVWAEASAYIMGVEKALAGWKPLLTSNGVLVFSDLVMLTSTPSEAVQAFWQKEYPDIQTIETRRAQIAKAGYDIVSDFTFEQSSWDNYYLPLKTRAEQLAPSMENSAALKDIQAEVEFYLKHQAEFGYQMFVLKPLN